MSRDKKCLYCGRRADSLEHLFLATLGGRLTKRNLCETCNSLVSPLDQEISNQLLLINSLLGVHGRKNKERMGLVKDATGAELIVNKYGQIENAECEAKRTQGANGETTITITGSERAVGKHLSELQAKGVLFHINERHRIVGYQMYPVTIPLAFGKQNGLREIARIALNFFEYFHPVLARDVAVGGLKGFILGHAAFSDDYVLPKFMPRSELIPENKFEFGHRIAVSLDETLQHAYAFVSFFSTIEFIVDFGRIEIDQSLIDIIDIDPLEKAMSAHINRHATIMNRFEIGASIAEMATFEQDRYLDELEIRLNGLYEKIDQRQFSERINMLYEKLINMRISTTEGRVRSIIDLLEDQRQIALLLLHRLCASLENLVRSNPRTSQWAEIFREFVLPDRSNPTGVSELTLHTMDLIIERFSVVICEQLDRNQMTIDSLRSLLAIHRGPSGELVGAMICKEVIFAILEKIIGRDRFLRMMAAAINMEGY